MANGIITEKKGKSKKAEVTKLQIKIMKKKLEERIWRRAIAEEKGMRKRAMGRKCGREDDGYERRKRRR